MKRFIWLIPAMLVFCISSVRAQEIPQVEISGGYSYLDAYLNGSHFHLHGGGAAATQYMNNWFGGRLEFSGYHGTDYGTLVSAQTITYGPVFSYRRFARVVPFGHVQFGVQHGSIGYLNSKQIPGGLSAGASKFAMAPGGGFDIVVTPRAAFRVDGEYLMTRFVGQRQDNLSLSLGIVIRIGKH